MLTYSDLKKFIEKYNIHCELVPQKKRRLALKMKDGKVVYYEEEYICGYHIGMNNIACRSGRSEWQWVWFEVNCVDELKDDDLAFFRERYSQVNGKSYTGFSEGWRIEQSIMNRLNN